MVAHAYSTDDQRQRQKDCEFKTTLDCMLPVTKYNKGWRCSQMHDKDEALSLALQ